MMIICILWLINNVKKIVVLLFALYFWIVSGKIKRIFRIPYIFPSRIKWKINCYCNGNMPVSFVYFNLFIALKSLEYVYNIAINGKYLECTEFLWWNMFLDINTLRTVLGKQNTWLFITILCCLPPMVVEKVC